MSLVYIYKITSGRRRSSLLLLACGDPKTRFLGCVNMAGAALKEIAAALKVLRSYRIENNAVM
jgi:hypothetical protein